MQSIKRRGTSRRHSSTRGTRCQFSVGARSAVRLKGFDVVAVPYNPFMWGRWGFAPGLVLDMLRVRLAHRDTQIALIIHEPYVPIVDLKSLVMGVWQRLQLGALILIAQKDLPR